MVAAGGGILEIVRLVLYGVEFISGIVVRYRLHVLSCLSVRLGHWFTLTHRADCLVILLLQVYGTTADKLSHYITFKTLEDIDTGDNDYDFGYGDLSIRQFDDVKGLCFFKAKESTCDAIIALGVILWLLLIAIIVWHCLAYLGKAGLPYLVEAIAFAVAAVGWFAVAIVTVAKAGGWKHIRSEVRAVQAFSWLNVGFHIGSAVVALFHFKVDGDGAAPAPAQSQA
jgi:hypothetical protein